GHNGDLRQKIMAIENFDKLVVGTILDEFKGKIPFRVAVLPDHATPVEVRTHTRDLVPFAIYGDGIDKDAVTQYNEVSVKESGLVLQKGYKIMDLLVKD
ncbi:MAG: phosphoglycerate mutase, partial [Candidatus Omnitrophota bacterium]